jgi:hypothetical protein
MQPNSLANSQYGNIKFHNLLTQIDEEGNTIKMLTFVSNTNA